MCAAMDGDPAALPPHVRSHLPPYNAMLRWTSTVVVPSGNATVDPMSPLHRKAKLRVRLDDLADAAQLDRRQAMALRALVGPRYEPNTGDVHFAIDKYPRREDNRREALRIVVALVREARKL